MDPWQRPAQAGSNSPPVVGPRGLPERAGRPASDPAASWVVITASIIGLISSLGYALLAVGCVVGLVRMSRGMGFLAVFLILGFGSLFLVVITIASAVSLGLLVGVLLLLLRRKSGRITCTAAALVAIPLDLFVGVAQFRGMFGRYLAGVPTADVQGSVVFAGLLGAVVVVILVWLPPSLRWCRASVPVPARRAAPGGPSARFWPR